MSRLIHTVDRCIKGHSWTLVKILAYLANDYANLEISAFLNTG